VCYNMKMICPKYLAAAVFVASVAVGVFSTEAAAQNAEDVRRLIEEQTLAINADSQVAEAYGKRGGLYILIDEYDLAIQDFQQVLAISKNKDERAAALLGIGLSHSGNGDHKEALKQINEAIRQNSKTMEAQAYLLRGYTHEALGDSEKADADFARAAKLGLGGRSP
ncbi:MAG: tetratricopeptide repeat protein, partial [Alphaproteobacteria bacterium]|nr:tetratricopeptide repeat protein [Alphaproteobacteria bacterium]